MWSSFLLAVATKSSHLLLVADSFNWTLMTKLQSTFFTLRSRKVVGSKNARCRAFFFFYGIHNVSLNTSNSMRSFRFRFSLRIEWNQRPEQFPASFVNCFPAKIFIWKAKASTVTFLNPIRMDKTSTLAVSRGHLLSSPKKATLVPD